MKSRPQNTAMRVVTAGVFALLACSGTSAQAQTSVTLYGILDAGLEYVSNSGGHSLAEVQSNGGAPSRLGLRGNEDLGGGLSALFVLEAPISVNNGASTTPFWAYASYVGLRSETYGTVTLGRQFDFLHIEMPPDSTTMIEGGLVEGFQGFSSPVKGAPPPAVDNHSGSGMYNNSIKWSYNNGPISGGLMYGFGPDSRHDNMQSAYLKYVNGGLELGAGWARDNFSTVLLANDVYSLRAVYTIGGLTLLANYSQGWETVFPGSQARARPFEVAANYYVTPSITVGAGVGIAWDRNRAGESATLTEPFVGARYLLSRRSMLYVMAALNHSSNPSAIPATVSVVGGAPDVSSSANQLAVVCGLMMFF
ncbi:porin [Paraburkholderia sp. J63]|uniref:porin n=1 Tax=Paraburkholderia sp. J63 TaxID=2805434 RepID=UPI002ABD2E74|nr:porin [Paraburkholderia sp. J63]